MSRSSLVAVPVLLGSLLYGTAMAQTPPAAAPGGGQADMMHMMALGARNQLGVLEYCQSKGAIGPDTVALQQKMIGMLPPTSTDGMDAAEATGKTGVIAFGGTQTSLTDAAQTQNTTVEALCTKLAAALQQAAKSMPQ